MNLMLRSLETAKQALIDQKEALCHYTGKNKKVWIEGYDEATKIVGDIQKELSDVMVNKHLDKQIKETSLFLNDPETYMTTMEGEE